MFCFFKLWFWRVSLDHTGGLSDNWRLGQIYCSPVTRSLLLLKWPNIPSHLVTALDVGATHLLPLDDARTQYMSVALIDANHCPGAVMFLWEGYFGSILYTGDFRYHPCMVMGGPLARPSLVVDTLLLDNTYLQPSFQFPSQHEAVEELLQQLQAMPQYRQYTVLVGVDTLGKERLLIDLALRLGTRVEVSAERWASLKAIHEAGGFDDDTFGVFFRDDAAPPADIGGPLLVLSSRNGLGMALGERKQRMLAQNPKCTPLVLGVIPTGWVHATVDKRQKYGDRVQVLRVPYSIHSSYSEILELVAQVKPTRVVPIVPNSPCPFEVLQPLLANRPLPEVVIPAGIFAKKEEVVQRTPKEVAVDEIPMDEKKPIMDALPIVQKPITKPRGGARFIVSTEKAARIAADVKTKLTGMSSLQKQARVEVVNDVDPDERFGRRTKRQMLQIYESTSSILSAREDNIDLDDIDDPEEHNH